MNLNVPMNKVFCFNCKYYKHEAYSLAYGNQCLFSIRVITTPFEEYIKYGDPREINKNNDCPNFKPSKWFRIKEFTKLVKYYLIKDFKHE